MSSSKYHLILVVLFFSFSCKVSTEYQRPEVALPEKFSEISYGDTSSIADIEWKQFFRDPILLKLIQKGIDHNYDLQVAITRIDIAGHQLKQSRSLQLPEIALQVSGQIARPSNNSLNGVSLKNFIGSSYVESYSAGVSFSWEADIWGKIRGQKEVALAEYMRTREAARAVQTQVVADIARGYFNLLVLDKQLEIAKRNLVLSDTFVSATRLLKDAGIGNALGVQQAEAQRQSTALLIPMLEQDIALQEHALQLLTGQLPGTITRNARLSDITMPSSLSSGLPVAMVSRRPDVRSAEMALVAANSRVGIARANMYPALNFTLGGGLESFKASNWFNIPNSLFGLAAGTIAQPIFKRGQLKAQHEIAQVEREQAVIQFRQQVLQATTEVSDAIVQLKKLDQQQTIASARVDTLQQAIGNAQLLFRSDMANYLEVITAQANTLQAQLNLAEIQGRQLQSMVELYRALGGGWK